MRLSDEDAWERLSAARHGSLATLHSGRGVDVVPVVFAVDDTRLIFVPVDTVKPKTTTRLQRIENVRDDPRCALLVDHYDEDWARLWWVRVHGRARNAMQPDLERFTPLLTARYERYRTPESIVGGLVVTPEAIMGWMAASPGVE